MKPLARWKLAAAALAGLLLVAAFPIHPVRVLAWVGLAPLLVALRGEPWRRRALLGWIAGFALFGGGLYWLVETMHHFGNMPLAASILGHVLFTAALALHVMLFAIAAPALGLERSWGIWVLAAGWVAVEYLRSFWFSGFPWLTIGYSQMGFLPMVQILDLTGIYGVSFLLAASAAAAARSWSAWTEGRPLPIAHLAALVLLAAATRAYGLVRLRAEAAPGKSIRVGMLQGNVPQDVKWDREFRFRTVELYAKLAREAAKEKLELLILPETAMPFFFQLGGTLAEQARDVARDHRVPVLFGAPAFRIKEGVVPPPSGQLSGDQVESLNRAYLLAADGSEIAHYDKMHLVPFGEWSPFPFLEKVVPGVGNFFPGQVRVLLDVPGLAPFAVLICYEAIFPMEARAAVASGAQFLVTITNDAWFGHLGAPWQHIEMGQARAIENREWQARAANTGISAIIDPWGRRVVETALDEETLLTGEIRTGPVLGSFYLRYGDVFARATLAVTIAALVAAAVAARRERRVRAKS